jgi:hypothetical protein
LNQIQHSEALDVCSNCHNGNAARGKSNNHCPTSLECDQCHSTNNWGNTLPNSPACNGTGGTPPPDTGGGTPTPTPGNQPPVAVINAPGAGGACNTNFTFNGGGSFDPDGDSITYQWWVIPQGDGTIATPRQSQTVIRFTATGDKTVRLVVSDGALDSAPAEVIFNVTGMMCF